MNRRKRSRTKRAEKLGYQAGIKMKHYDECPYQITRIREKWLGGWRKAKEDLSLGRIQRVH
ncbi:MAG TPA: ribosome modulation factor [Aeromonadales bacterium]|nr:ribosome modulation factor [Aeromonadales bacterium]